MEVKILIVSVVFACFVCYGVQGERIPQENHIWEEDYDKKLENDSPVFYGSLSDTGLDNLPIDLLEIDKDIGEEIEGEKLSGSEVDEETIRTAEKKADKDLLNGLNRMLKNNETLKDVLKTENVYEIP